MTTETGGIDINWDDDEAVVRAALPDVIIYYLCKDRNKRNIHSNAVGDSVSGVQSKGDDSLLWQQARRHESVQAFERAHSPAFAGGAHVHAMGEEGELYELKNPPVFAKFKRDPLPAGKVEIGEGLPDYMIRYEFGRDPEGFSTGTLVRTEFGQYIQSVSVFRMKREMEARLQQAEDERDKAREEAIRECGAICEGTMAYWDQKADAARKRGNHTGAAECMTYGNVASSIMSKLEALSTQPTKGEETNGK